MLWHKQLGHVSITKLWNIQKAEDVLGLPMLKQCDVLLCSEFLVGKHNIKTSHKVNDQGSSKCILDQGSSHVDSLRGKIYALVIVDD